jgi:malate dehydrogenase (oxaloacetate-decarboxylating)(NADP+)
MSNLETKTTNIGKYIFLRSLENRNERLYYRVIMEHIRELMPIVYTPTVGEACLEFAQIFRHAKGFYITPEDRGQIRQILDNWPTNEVKIIVVTDGERILGLGDLGANGMGIPIGKLDLYIAGGGIDPKFCLPVMLDVGTENRELLDNPFYLGWPERRLRGAEYLSLVEEFVFAVQDKFPKALIQFEDFATPNAYLLMERFQNAVLSFNDDIQGTAAVAVAGMKSAVRISGTPFADLRVMFLGAGSAATGIARLLIRALQFAGLEEAEARSRIIFVDEHGVLSEDRGGLKRFQPGVRRRRWFHELRRSHRILRPPRPHRRHRGSRDIQSRSHRNHGDEDRAAHHLRPVQPHRPCRVYRRTGVPMDRRQRHIRQRQSLRGGGNQRDIVPAGPGE